MKGNLRAVYAGEFAVSDHPDDILVTYGVGPCVVIALHDAAKKLGGMLCAILPNGPHTGKSSKSVEAGINGLIEALVARGAAKSSLHAYLCGGAQMIQSAGFELINGLGPRNVTAAKEALQKANITLHGEATGGHMGRSVKLPIATGQLLVKTLRSGEQCLLHHTPLAARSAKLILIVDDSAFVVNRLVHLLHKHGFQTCTAKDGVEAVQAFSAERPDVVLMDVTMPNKDGLSALHDIRKMAPCARVIMMTALDQQELAIQSLRAGAVDFLPKPVIPENLLGCLKRVLQ